MNPWLTTAASWAAGKLAGALSPSRSGGARAATDSARATLNGYRGGYANLYQRGMTTLDSYQPQLDAAVADYGNYLRQDYGQSPQDAADIAAATESIQMDARHAASQATRRLPTDSEASGAVAGAQTAIADTALTNQAKLASAVMTARIQRRERAKQALVSLMADQVVRGRGDALSGLGGGSSLAGQLVGLAQGRESQALAEDQAAQGGWQALAAQLAQLDAQRSTRPSWWY